jgi:acyl transferase domain-containing protein
VSKWGAFLDDFAGFDSEFFGINEREAIALATMPSAGFRDEAW